MHFIIFIITKNSYLTAIIRYISCSLDNADKEWIKKFFLQFQAEQATSQPTLTCSKSTVETPGPYEICSKWTPASKSFFSRLLVIEFTEKWLHRSFFPVIFPSIFETTFYEGTSRHLLLLVNFWSVFRVQSNIYDGSFWKISLRFPAVNCFRKKFHLRCFIGFWMRLCIFFSRWISLQRQFVKMMKSKTYIHIILILLYVMRN